MKKRSVLVVGAGNVGLRIVDRLRRRALVTTTSRTSAKAVEQRKHGATPRRIDLDRPQTLHAVQRLDFDAVIYLAPPSTEHPRDLRLRRFLHAIVPKSRRDLAFVYVSTSGVYGDCRGALIDESRPVRPFNARARRRVDAERTVTRYARRHHWHATILRAPGIYDALHLPVDRIKRGLPAIVADEDSYTNHIHADDLAAMCIDALRSKRTARIYHASDDSQLKMGDWFDLVADAFALPRPPRLPRYQIASRVGPMLWSFMRESRRLSNARIKRELRSRLEWSTAQDFLAGRHR